MQTLAILSILFLGSAMTAAVIAAYMHFLKSEFTKEGAVYMAITFGIVGFFCMTLGV